MRTYPAGEMTSAETFEERRGLVVRRLFIDGRAGHAWCQISAWRNGRRHPTYQGEIEVTAGGWQATDARSNPVGVFTDFADAQAALLRIRTGVLSTVRWDGPRPTRPVCVVCGDPKPCDGQNTGHWTYRIGRATAGVAA